MTTRVLVVDDEKLIRWALRERLEREGYALEEAEDGASARKAFQKHSFDVALIDLKLPDSDGITLLKEARQAQPDLPVIIITAYSSVEGAVGAIKSGAADYITKPFNMDDLVITVSRVLESNTMRRAITADLSQKQAQFGLVNIVGESERILDIKALIRKIIQGPSTTILILGESGSGKDMAARAIHYESDRAAHPFMNITCTALPETLLESELFGFEAGAFTNATAQKKGLFELAQNGTVFMDEVGDMPLALQAKLLRVLEEKTFKRIGGGVDHHIDVRIIAATNHDLAGMVARKEFREDLYYRLNIVPIVMPPLRERQEDIAPLAQHFLALYNREFRKSFTGLSADAARKLDAYAWPGNVRELRNAIERAVLLSGGDQIEADDVVLGRVPYGAAPQDDGEAVVLPVDGCTLADAEKSLLQQALKRCGWNQTKAGKLLGISRDQVRYKMDKYGLEPETCD